MGRARLTSRLAAAALLLLSHPLHATPTSRIAPEKAPQKAVLPLDLPDAAARNSLKADASRHPAEYLTFETRIAAQRFLRTHGDAAEETDRAMILHGIVGYWHGKTLAVVPSLPSANVR